MKKLIFILISISTLSSCKKDLPLDYQPTPYSIILPSGFPEMDIPDDNPITIEGVALGDRLFNDPILSKDSTLSCSGCHIRSSSFINNNKCRVE